MSDVPPDGLPPAPKPPEPLGYGRPDPRRAAVPLVGQFFLGLGAWVGLAAAAFGLLRTNLNGLLATAGIALAIGLALGVWLRVRYQWRGFLPGLLIGVGLTCLVPIGLIAYFCKTLKI